MATIRLICLLNLPASPLAPPLLWKRGLGGEVRGF